METHELLMTALRSLAVFVSMLVVIRCLGKRTVGNFSAFDLLVALMLGEVVDEIIYADVSAMQGAIAILAIALAQYGNSWLSYWGHGMEKILEGAPTILVKNGELQTAGMRAELTNEQDVIAHLRLKGIEDLSEVKFAIMENDGEVSVIRRDWAQPLRRADFLEDAARQRRADLEGTLTRPIETDSSSALEGERSDGAS